jgi:transposase
VVTLSEAGEGDDAYGSAGHTGQPEGGKNQERPGRRRCLPGQAGRGTLAQARPPVCGMMQRDGHVVSTGLAHVKHKTIEPCMQDTRIPGTRGSTDASSIEARLQSWGDAHKQGNHGRGELARDDDGAGVWAVHGHPMAGGWSRLRRWLRPPRGIAQEQRPVSLGFFACVHNVRKRGKALLGALIEFLGT